MDIPQRQLGVIILPPDPLPLMNARPEQYPMDEEPTTIRITEDGRERAAMDMGEGIIDPLRDVQMRPQFPAASAATAITGALVLEDGSVLLLEDGSALLTE